MREKLPAKGLLYLLEQLLKDLQKRQEMISSLGHHVIAIGKNTSVTESSLAWAG